MQVRKTTNAFAIITLVMLIIGNLANALWTVWLTMEQFKTGWGYGTDMEILTIVPWIFEIVCAPLLITATIYLLAYIVERSSKPLFIINVVLYVLLVSQYVMTNVFIWN